MEYNKRIFVGTNKPNQKEKLVSMAQVYAGDFSQNMEVGSDRNDEIAPMSSSMQMFLEMMRAAESMNQFTV